MLHNTFCSSLGGCAFLLSYAQLLKTGFSLLELQEPTKQQLPLKQNRSYEMVYQRYLPENENEVSIYTALGVGAVLEMEDPIGGRHFRCLNRYFENWLSSEPTSSARAPLDFFEWLDFGPGLHLTTVLGCGRSKPHHLRLHKFSLSERKSTEVDVNVLVGRNASQLQLVYTETGQQVDPREYLFVWGRDRKLYIAREEKIAGSHVKHTSFFSGRPVLHAGELAVSAEGMLTWVSGSSGHYRPRLRHIRSFFIWLRDSFGTEQDQIEWKRDLGDGVLTDEEFSSIFE